MDDGHYRGRFWASGTQAGGPSASFRASRIRSQTPARVHRRNWRRPTPANRSSLEGPARPRRSGRSRTRSPEPGRDLSGDGSARHRSRSRRARRTPIPRRSSGRHPDQARPSPWRSPVPRLIHIRSSGPVRTPRTLRGPRPAFVTTFAIWSMHDLASASLISRASRLPANPMIIVTRES